MAVMLEHRVAVFAVILYCLTVLPNGRGQPFDIDPPFPSVGDILLINVGQGISKVQVYLPDSADPQLWGEICMEDIGNAKAVGTVICRQFGYTSGNVTSKPLWEGSASTDVNVWMHNVDCGNYPPSHYHILRCGYKVNNTPCSPAYVQCDGHYLTDPRKRYDGQVYLCPPRSSIPTDYQYSSSTGVVLVYLHDSWGVINFNTTVTSGSLEKDTICRQLGFTRSSTLRASSDYDYSHCYHKYNNSQLPVAIRVWLTASQFSCSKGVSEPCSGCCYDYPSKGISLPTQHIKSDLQVTCEFDPDVKTVETEGSPSLCPFNDHSQMNSDACPGLATPHTVIIVGAVLGFAMLASLVLAVIGWICFIVKRRQNRIGENRPLLQDHGGQGQPRRLNQLRNDDPGE